MKQEIVEIEGRLYRKVRQRKDQACRYCVAKRWEKLCQALPPCVEFDSRKNTKASYYFKEVKDETHCQG